MIRVTVWNEGVHEVESPEIAAVYPHGIHGQIKSFLDTQEDIEVRTATLNDPDCGLPPEVLENTDVLIWWGHKAHDEVPDELVERVHDRVLRGMGFIALHSAHFSKPFKRLMGTSCALHWRDGDFERLWTVNPAHPIAKGIGEYVEIPVEEMYGESFDIPEPDELVLWAGSPAEMCSARAAAGEEGAEKYSISSPATRATPPTTSRRFSRY